MSILFNRVVSQLREVDIVPDPTAGGMRSSAPRIIQTGVRCTIQAEKTARMTGYGHDDTGAQKWLVIFERTYSGPIVVNDVLTDDLGRTFRVRVAYPTRLGWQAVADDLTVGGR